MDRPFFQAQNEAELFIDVLRTNTLAGKFKLHDFVVMPDHFHVLLTVDGNTSIERAVQLIKGGYSFRRNKELRLADLAARIFRGAGPGPEEFSGAQKIYR
jgi:putative transposase